MVSVEQVDTAARELWKMDCDRSRAPGMIVRTGNDPKYEWVPAPYDGEVRERYVRNVLTVLRHTGVASEAPDGFEGANTGKGPGGCARGYCRAVEGCEAGVCKAVC